MKLLITGGSGFIGSSVVRLAVSKNYKVVNLDLLTYAANPKNVESVTNSSNYSFECADICNKFQVQKVFEKHQPDVVLHLAAETHVDRSIDGPTNFINTNIIGTFNLLEASLSCWKRKRYKKNFRFHHVSTDEVFGSLPYDSKTFFNEETPYRPHSPYSASKASSDHLVRAWGDTYGLPINITNCSNNYGPYQFPDKFIPVIILNAIFNKPIPIYGDGKNVRDWLYVDDHAEALLKVIEFGQIGSTYVIGGMNQISNNKLVRKICQILNETVPKSSGSYLNLIKFVKDRPGHDMRYAIDPTHIKEKVGWVPTITIEEGLRKTVAWYLKNKSWWEPMLKEYSVGERLGLIK